MVVQETKPTRLVFDTYLKLIKNSTGSRMFRNFYIKNSDNLKIDALDNGENSCAFYVSSILVIFGKIERVHGTVAALVSDLNNSGWVEANRPKKGDVLIWEAIKQGSSVHEHAGFYIGNNKAVSNSSSKKSPQIHDKNFGPAGRKITQIFRLDAWEV